MSKTLTGEKGRWEQETLKPALEKKPDRDERYSTVSDYPIRRLYTEEDLPEGWSPASELGMPGPSMSTGVPFGTPPFGSGTATVWPAAKLKFASAVSPARYRAISHGQTRYQDELSVSQ